MKTLSISATFIILLLLLIVATSRMLDFLSVLEILNVNGGNVNNDTNDFGNIFISLTLFVHKIHTTNGMKKIQIMKMI